MQPDNETLDKLVQRILQVVRPLRIILFGSAARGDMGPDSDLDLLVVMPDGTDCRRTAKLIYRDINGVRVPFDVVVATPALLAKHARTPGLIYRRVMEEGIEIYAA